MSINFCGLQQRLRERLLAHIDAGEFTGVELARRTGFQQAHISKFLNRKRGLSLEAMDHVLEVMEIPLADLLREEAKASARKSTTNENVNEIAAIPIVAGDDCTATRVPISDTLKVLQVALRFIERLPTRMLIPRPHWDRFVAWRVTNDDANAMSPRLERGAIAVIDRHYNSLAPWRGGRNMYLVKNGSVLVRYAERAHDKLVLRPHRTLARLMWAEVEQIVGRVCLVQKVM